MKKDYIDITDIEPTAWRQPVITVAKPTACPTCGAPIAGQERTPDPIEVSVQVEGTWHVIDVENISVDCDEVVVTVVEREDRPRKTYSLMARADQLRATRDNPPFSHVVRFDLRYPPVLKPAEIKAGESIGVTTIRRRIKLTKRLG